MLFFNAYSDLYIETYKNKRFLENAYCITVLFGLFEGEEWFVGFVLEVEGVGDLGGVVVGDGGWGGEHSLVVDLGVGLGIGH